MNTLVILYFLVAEKKNQIMKYNSKSTSNVMLSPTINEKNSC